MISTFLSGPEFVTYFTKYTTPGTILSMQVFPLGKTGLSLSALGFGAAPLGGAYGATSQAEANHAVRAALDLGINFFDVSPYYGNAEEVLGRALVGIPRESYVLCTKLGRYGPSNFDFSPQKVKISVEESLRKLQTDYLDILLCHDIEFVPLGPVIDETLPSLRIEQAEGKTRFVGVSGLPLKIFTEVLEKTDLDVVLSYCHASLNDDSLTSLLPFLESKNVGVIGASPLSMGLLTDDGPPEWHPAPPALKEAAARAAAHCRARGKSLAALALSVSLRIPGISTMLVGMPTEDQVRKNVAALDAPLDEELLAEVSEILAPVKNLTWPSGLL
jgi:L-galactose dehydrogenase